MKDLKEFAKNVYSQNGEDGILQEILNRLNIETGVCVEFGAASGRWFSNTFDLIENHEWDGIYIEGEKESFVELQKLADDYDFLAVNKYVSAEGENSLDNILSQIYLSHNFEILSIDVDGIDYHIWKGFKNYTPKIVIIEVNSSVPPPIEQTHGEGKQGSSFTSMLKLGIEKGYDLVCHTGNMIFVRMDLTPGLFGNMNDDILFTDKWVRK